MRTVVCALVLALAAPALADEPAPRVAEVPLRGVKVAHPGDTAKRVPVEIGSADELAKSPVFPDEAGRDAIKKHVDFAKQKLVLFAWSGSGGDKLTAALSKDGKSVTFAYTAGLTDDLRRHVKLFVVPRDAEVKK